ncbi:hypothetical protein KIW84_044358 [Lathyrus oleraceus]|uniref:Uncharacterized protein n=1 Tax=Pisum sativum TaxID=3888 RepID=A0A9D4XG14_PEA|nr:hypothetical protein KIW84_044358 [Pisum sativum]
MLPLCIVVAGRASSRDVTVPVVAFVVATRVAEGNLRGKRWGSMMNCCHNVPDWNLPNVLLDSGIFPVHRKCWRNISDASIIPVATNCSSVASLEHDVSTPSRKLSFLKSISDEV